MKNKNASIPKLIAFVELPPVIQKVEMVHGGSDGLKITYANTEIRNGIGSSIKSRNRHWARPVQKELRELFVQLKEHLLYVTGHAVTEKDKPLQEENITVTYALMLKSSEHNVKFQLGGTKKVHGDYIVVLNGPLVHIDDYENYDTLGRILDKIMEETKLFMSGEKGADSRQVTVDYLMLKKDMPDAENELDKMSPEEQKKWRDEAFHHYGLTIVEENGEKVITCDEDGQEIIEKVKPVEQDNKKIERKEDEIPLFSETANDDDFVIPINN